MRVTIHQPNYLPWRGFVEKARVADVLVLLDTVQFSKGSYTNRTRMRSNSAEGWSWMTVPVHHRLGQSIGCVEVVDDGWRSRHFSWLKQTYQRSPFWRTMEPILRPVYATSWSSLGPLNSVLISVLLEAFAVETRIVMASGLGCRGIGSDYLLAICQELGATTYLSGESGPDYLDMGSFTASGIDVQVSRFQPNCYPPYSAVDDLFMEEE